MSIDKYNVTHALRSNGYLYDVVYLVDPSQPQFARRFMIVPGEYVLEKAREPEIEPDKIDVPGLLEITDRYGTTRRVIFKPNAVDPKISIKEDLEIQDLQRKVINEEIRTIQKEQDALAQEKLKEKLQKKIDAIKDSERALKITLIENDEKINRLEFIGKQTTNKVKSNEILKRLKLFHKDNVKISENIISKKAKRKKLRYLFNGKITKQKDVFLSSSDNNSENTEITTTCTLASSSMSDEEGFYNKKENILLETELDADVMEKLIGNTPVGTGLDGLYKLEALEDPGTLSAPTIVNQPLDVVFDPFTNQYLQVEPPENQGFPAQFEYQPQPGEMPEEIPYNPYAENFNTVEEPNPYMAPGIPQNPYGQFTRSKTLNSIGINPSQAQQNLSNLTYSNNCKYGVDNEQPLSNDESSETTRGITQSNVIYDPTRSSRLQEPVNFSVLGNIDEISNISNNNRINYTHRQLNRNNTRGKHQYSNREMCSQRDNFNNNNNTNSNNDNPAPGLIRKETLRHKNTKKGKGSMLIPDKINSPLISEDSRSLNLTSTMNSPSVNLISASSTLPSSESGNQSSDKDRSANALREIARYNNYLGNFNESSPSSTGNRKPSLQPSIVSRKMKPDSDKKSMFEQSIPRRSTTKSLNNKLLDKMTHPSVERTQTMKSNMSTLSNIKSAMKNSEFDNIKRKSTFKPMVSMAMESKKLEEFEMDTKLNSPLLYAPYRATPQFDEPVTPLDKAANVIACEELRKRCEECSNRGEFTRNPKRMEDLPPPQFLSREDAAWARLPEPGMPTNSKLAHAVDMAAPVAQEVIIFDFAETMMLNKIIASQVLTAARTENIETMFLVEIKPPRQQKLRACDM